MIGTLRGTLIIKKPDNLIVEAGGVGYQVNVSVNTLSTLPTESEEVFLYIYTHVREDILQLYGFHKEEEKRMFISLISVSGIGPKVALNILSSVTHTNLLRAIEAEDIDSLTKIQGLGKKTANRLVLELRGKLPVEEIVRDRVYEDTLSALVNLGYRRADASQALDIAYKKGLSDIESLLKESLRMLTTSGKDEKR